MSPGNTAGKGSDYRSAYWMVTTINHDILGLKTILGLMARTYGNQFW